MVEDEWICKWMNISCVDVDVCKWSGAGSTS